tara:strand:+ start:300 stop:596 length:297 start_codon:yes stop_codon:yes gene_type:complete
MSNLDVEIYDLIDLLSFTLGKEFLEKWRFKYGDRMIKLFQLKIINSLRKSKNIKLKSIFRYLHKDSGFSEEIAENFLIDIDFAIYSPIIVGSLKELRA